MLLKQSVMDIVQSRYRVLSIVDMLEYDQHPEVLEQFLQQYQGHVFAANERVVILHHDTDYYVSPGTPGFSMYNLMLILKTIDIPLEFVLFITNHYGIEAELADLAQANGAHGNVRVVYTAQWFDFPDTAEVQMASAPAYLYCSLNGQQRDHRLSLLTQLAEHDLLSAGILSYNFA